MSPPPQNKLDVYFAPEILDDAKKERQETLKKLSEQKIEPKLEPEEKLSRDEKREKKKFVDTMMYGLTAPIVFGSRQWASSYPEKQLEYARMIRLAKAVECVDQEMCTLTDIVAFMYPLTMDAPLRREYYKMYCYAYKYGLPTEWKLLVEWEPDIARDAVLYDNEYEELRIIRRKIFNRQMQMVKSHS